MEILRDYRRIVDRIYQPEAYFARVRHVVESLNCSQKRLSLSPWHHWRDLKGLARIIWQQGIKAPYRRLFWSTLFSVVRQNPRGLRYGINLMAFFLHFGPFSRYVVSRIDEAIDQEEAAQNRPRPTRPANELVVVAGPQECC